MIYLFACLKQRFLNINVYRKEIDSKIMIAESRYLDSNQERYLRLLVDISTFKILQAYADGGTIFGKERLGPIYLNSLEGIYASINEGASINQALQEVQEDTLTVSLVKDVIRTLIQAETFVCQERGFATSKEYSDYWEDVYRGRCCYYSNLDRISRTWDEVASEFNREHLLFSRFRSQHLYDIGKLGYLIIGNMLDTVHELSVIIKCNRQGIIEEVNSDLTRVTDKICQEAKDFCKHLYGKEAFRLSKKETANLLGSNEGCTHLIDLTYDGLETFSQWWYTKKF